MQRQRSRAKCREVAFAHKWADRFISIVHVENHALAAVAKNNGMSLWKQLPDYEAMPVDVFEAYAEA